jgi:hypothetical protein
LDEPNILLYCLEPQNRQAIFIEVPDVTEVRAAPFYFQAQFEQAVRVLKVPYETLEQLADQVTLNDQRMILIYSMGRSGTTVTSAAFRQVENVVSLSEPDVFTQLVQMHDFSGSNDAEISALIRVCMLLTCKDQGNGDQPIWVLKFRSFVIDLAHMIDTHFPGATSLFLYRQAVTWGASNARAFGGTTSPTQEQLTDIWAFLNPLVPRINHYRLDDPAEINFGKIFGLMWLDYMECCLARLDAGQAILPVRYEDLRANPEAVVNEIFKYCVISGINRNKLDAVLEVDSQANTPIARERLKQIGRELNIDDVTIAQHIITTHPIINTPAYQLPGTLLLEKVPAGALSG